jgi:hypothetical protein|uniref:Uncharacterized protein n=1 Tax=viral metagenome TaxID=1070528 RepID=A0A6C0CNU9_9ZZZZ|tara:strand:+ start:3202 stop:4335 length:1134 start_codon:yes stop_codon:yes gene_type:complete
MDGEIVIERNDGNVMKLDDNEQAILDEISLDFAKPPRPQMMNRSRLSPEPQPTKRVAFQEDIDSFANPTKTNAPPPPQNEPPIDYGEYEDEAPQMGGGFDYGPGEVEEQPSPGYKTVDEEKADLVNKLGRLEKKGFAVNKRLNVYSPVDELRTEVKRITYSIDVDKSVKFSRRMLIACVTGLEFMNKRYNPFEIQLEGWSENVMENVDDYDEVFEELYVKYRTKMHVAPEVKLIMMLGGSAMMFHLTNSMFKQVMPNMNDVMKQNPGLMQNMMSAVQNTVSKSDAASSSAAAPGERREMQGPGLDISSLMGNIMMPPAPPMSTTSLQPQTSIDEDDDISDIVSIQDDDDNGDDEVKEVKMPAAKGRKGRKKKVEINL